MRVGFLMGYFLPVPAVQGGAMEKTALRLATLLAERGIETGIISRRWEGFANNETRDGVAHVRLPGFRHSRSLPRNLLLDALWCARTLPAARRFDVLVTSSVVAPIILPRLLGRRSAVVPWIARMPRGQTRHYGRARRMVALSRAVEKQIIYENAGRRHPRIEVVPLSIDWRQFAAASAQPAIPGRVVIGYAGRIHPLKGLDLLLEACARLRTAHHSLSDWELRIFGAESVAQGGAGEAYRAGLQSRWGPALENRITWGGFIGNPAQLAAECGRMDIFCYPSLDESGETFGVAAAEAMAAGAVPVVSSLACFSDFVTDGENGFRFDHRGQSAAERLASVLDDLIRNPDRTRRMGVAASRDVQRLDHSVLADRWKAILENVMEEHR